MSATVRTASGRVRVLVVDDSAFARKVLREALSEDERIEVVGTARDGLEALESIGILKPDVVTLDLVMPELDGLGVLMELDRSLPAGGGPRVVVVSISDEDSALGIEALQRGAVALVHKPTALATERLYNLSAELVSKVLEAGCATARRTSSSLTASRGVVVPVGTRTARGVKLVVIGTSTGGPQALTRLLTALPADLPAAVAIALHIPEGYTEALARRLDGVCAISVAEAKDGMSLRPGLAVVARGGMQLKLHNQGARVVARLDLQPLTANHVPSVDVLFETAAAGFGAQVLGVVLTGMGDDGLKGARAISAAGGTVVTESESSCVVYGMPRTVFEAGLSTAQAPIHEMAALIVRHL